MEEQPHKEDLSEEAVRAYVAGISQSLRERSEYWKAQLAELRAAIEPYRGGEYADSYRATANVIDLFHFEVEWLAELSLAIAPPAGGTLSPH